MSGCETSPAFDACKKPRGQTNDLTALANVRSAVASVCREIGLRFHPTRGAMSLGKSKGGLPPDSVCEEEDACLKDMRRCIEEYHDNSK